MSDYCKHPFGIGVSEMPYNAFKNRKLSSLLLLVFCVILFPAAAFAQTSDNIRLPKFRFNAGAGEYDTVGVKRAEEVSKEAAGVLETEINPEEYIVGPGDVLGVFILTTGTMEFDAVVSPEGKLLLPNIGAVSLKNTTLATAEKIVTERVNKVFKTREVALSLKKLRTFKVTLLGAVRRPTIVTATAADRISEVIDRAGGLLNNSSLRRITIERESVKTSLTADLQRFYSLGEKTSNPTVLGGDKITVPYTFEKQVVTILGEVALPGNFEFKEGDKLSTLIGFAKGFLPSAFLDSVEIVRFKNGTTDIERFFLDLNGWSADSQNSEDDILLKSGDRVYVRAIPNWEKPNTVAIRGEVRFPGTYSITPNVTRLKDAIAMAGGYTENAALESSVLVRRSEWELEDRELSRLYNTPAKDMTEEEARYFKARARENRGAIVVDFNNIEKGSNNVILLEKDSVHIASRRDFVNIIGRINSPGRIQYNASLTYDDYIALAGGYGYRADKGNIVVIKPNGVQYPAGSGNYRIEPGDNILIPEEPETDYGEIFTTSLTVLAQLISITAIVISLRTASQNN